jgi:hypothetical protein
LYSFLAAHNRETLFFWLGKFVQLIQRKLYKAPLYRSYKILKMKGWQWVKF